MAFGYDMLTGWQGVSGYCRKEGEKIEIHARGLEPGESCAVYELLPGCAEKRDEKTADGNGQAVFTCRGGEAFFVASKGRVRLWQGGEENCLRACEWMQKEKIKKEETPKSISSETSIALPAAETEETIKEEPEAARDILARDLEEIQRSGKTEEGEKMREELPNPAIMADKGETEKMESDGESIPSEPEPSYSLRSPSTGEPVDALPN